MTQLTDHFTLEELTRSEVALRNGWDNTPNGDEVANLTRLAQLLEHPLCILSQSHQLNELSAKPMLVQHLCSHQQQEAV